MRFNYSVFWAVLALVFSPLPAVAALLPPNPLCNSHLVIVRPDAFTAAEQSARLVVEEGSAFGSAAAIASPLAARLTVRSDGDYTLWIRVGQKSKGPTPLRAELLRAGKVVLSRVFHDGLGSEEWGGPEAATAYLKNAIQKGSSGIAITDVNLAIEQRQRELSRADKSGAAGLLAGEGSDNLLDELRQPSGANWVNLGRVEPRAPAGFHWWKIGRTNLPSGEYQLRISVVADPAGATPLVDAAFLTAFDKLTYPYVIDINAPRASYIRFRIDKLPAGGLSIGAVINTHAFPLFSTPVVNLNPSEMSQTHVTTHTQTGYTPWYRLQDIERAPNIKTAGQVQLHLLLKAARVGNKDWAGVTEFAMQPYSDDVVRTFDWSEPEGLKINLVMDFEQGLHHLKTFRDCAREHYDRALESAANRLYPLTRDGLYVGPCQGTSTPDTHDYLCKTMRLLGYNVVGMSTDPIGTSKRFGWGHYSGAPRMSWFMPFTDEPAALKQYTEKYQFLQDRKEFYEACPIWQMTDEPGEGYRNEMTAPLWRYVDNQGPEPKLVDLPGSAGLNTIKTNYQDCVLEGKLARLGTVVRLLVATNDAEKPTRYAYWRLGTVLPDGAPKNVMAGKEGLGPKETSTMLTLNASLDDKLTPFKIVYEKDVAALYIRDKLISQLNKIPTSGGFGFAEGAKAISALRIRPIAPREHIGTMGAEATAGRPAAEANQLDVTALVADLKTGEETLPDWARPKPLQTFVKEDWIVTGGHPEAHEGFRQWLAVKGVTPDLFGVKTWSEVNPLTIRELLRDQYDNRLFYWSRQYSAYLTPKMFSLAAAAIRQDCPNPKVQAYVGLSGGYPNAFGMTVLDMFQLASYDNGLMPGISDWYTASADSEQVNAYSAAIFNGGARRYGREPASISMMHIVHPTPLRAFACLANEVKYLSYYTFGPFCLGVGGDAWSENRICYDASSQVDNRVGQVDDILARAHLRPARVAMLWSQATDHWDQASSFRDKRAAFLALSHEYFQPELVTEEQVLSGAIEHYDALYVLEPYVVAGVQARIADWVKAGGLLWACADAITKNEYNEPCDLLHDLCRLQRTFAVSDSTAKTTTGRLIMSPVASQADFLPHTVVTDGMAVAVQAPDARIRARYDDGRSAWLECSAGKGRVVYLTHRAGLTYSAQRIRGNPVIWADTGRAPLTVPLLEAKIDRQLVLSDPLVLATPLSTADGTVVVLYNMQPTPRHNLVVTLKEPQAPQSVQRFAGFDLVPQPFEFKDGTVQVMLGTLDKEQMLVVRRRPAPLDDRSEKEKQKAAMLLNSTNALNLAAGTWLAGFHSDWQMADRIVPLLQHAAWEVRRSAVEALGRLKYTAASDAVVAALAKETDAHAQGDEIRALARLRDARTPEVCRSALANGNVFVQRQAVLAAIELLSDGTPDTSPPEMNLPAFARQMAEVALRHPDIRVRQEGIHLLMRLDPDDTLARAVIAFTEPTLDALAQPHWAAAVMSNDAAFAGYLKLGMPGGDAMLLALAGIRPEPALAGALALRLDQVNKLNVATWVQALTTQRDKTLTRRVFETRQKLAELADHLPRILESTFEARLGGNLVDWDHWLREHHD